MVQLRLSKNSIEQTNNQTDFPLRSQATALAHERHRREGVRSPCSVGVSVRPLIVVLALLGAVQSAHAQITGNDLYERCSVKEGRDEGFYNKSGYCVGFIDGVFAATIPTISFCGWNGVTSGQLKDIVLQYLYTHPAERHQLANDLVVRALKQAFPCKN